MLTGTPRGHGRSALTAGSTWGRFLPGRERADYAAMELAPLDVLLPCLEAVDRAGRGDGSVMIMHSVRDAADVRLPAADNASMLREALDRIADDAARYEGMSDVLLLGRYRHSRPRNVAGMARRYPALRLAEASSPSIRSIVLTASQVRRADSGDSA